RGVEPANRPRELPGKVDPAAHAAGSPQAPESITPARTPGGATMTESSKHPILVVDDEPDILLSLRALLRRDFDVHTAEDGSQALEEMHRHPVHVIMTDQRMPKMTGVELLSRARGECPDT